MGGKKKLTKAKEPIALRFKSLANGNKSLYLDYYREGKRTYDFLKLYLIPESDSAAKIQNANTLQAANAIKAQRLIDIANGKAGLTKKSGYEKMLLVDWLDKFKGKLSSSGKSKSYIKSIEQLKRMIIGHEADNMRLIDIDRNFCAGFLNYLRTYKTRYGRVMSDFTVYQFYQCFVVSLNAAVDDGILDRNPCHDCKERPRDPESTRTYLNVDEVKKLIATDCTRESVKMAFLFGCFCGLRFSDIVKLRWKDIYKSGSNTFARVFMQKTGKEIDVILSAAAMRWMPEQGDKKGEGLVFELPSHGRVSKIVKKWAQSAQISKYVTFHTSRHTFATITLNDGKASLYVVSKMLGHKDIKTTQIYADVLEREKASAVDAVAALFESTPSSGKEGQNQK